MARRPRPSLRALLFRCGERALCKPWRLEDRSWRPWPAGPVRPSGPCCFGVAIAPCVSFGGWKTGQTASFLVGSESNVRQWGPWPAGPVRPSGPCCFGVASAPCLSLGGWKTAKRVSFLVGAESDVRHWGRWPAGPFRALLFGCGGGAVLGQTATFLVGSESNVRQWGPWPAGPVRPSGPCCFGVASAPCVSLVRPSGRFGVAIAPCVSFGGWKTGQTASFLVGSESNVRQWGPWPAGPVRPSGPCCFGVASAPCLSLGGWKTAKRVSFLVGAESDVRHWGRWPAGPVRPSGPCCFGVASAQGSVVWWIRLRLWSVLHGPSVGATLLSVGRAMRYLNLTRSFCWMHHCAACWTCVRKCTACKQAIRNANFFAAAITAAVIDLPCCHSALHRFGAMRAEVCVHPRRRCVGLHSKLLGRWMGNTRSGFVCSHRRLSSLVEFLNLLANVCYSRIASCRWRDSRWRKRAKRWFVRWARRHTKAKAVHALHTCVPSCVCFRLCCQAVNSARGLRSLHWEHCQHPRCLVAHSLQQRRSALRAFHAAGPNSASGFATPHLKHGFFIWHVKHTRKKTTLPLAMLFWKIGLDMPQLAHVALPRGSSICIMFCALATHPVRVAALPLAWCERCALFSFCASWTHAFFAIFCEQRLPVDGVAAEVSQKKVPAQTDSLLEWRGVERAEDQQLPTALDTGDCNVNREWVAHWADTKIGHHAFFDGLPLRNMRCDTVVDLIPGSNGSYSDVQKEKSFL